MDDWAGVSEICLQTSLDSSPLRADLKPMLSYFQFASGSAVLAEGGFVKLNEAVSGFAQFSDNVFEGVGYVVNEVCERVVWTILGHGGERERTRENRFLRHRSWEQAALEVLLDVGFGVSDLFGYDGFAVECIIVEPSGQASECDAGEEI